MIGLVLRRLLVVPPVLLAATVLVFALPRLADVDPARAVLRARSAEAVPDPATEARVRASLGLDASPVEQYLRWLGALLRGDLGYGYVLRTPVLEQVGGAAAVSGLLAVLALALAAAVGIPAGAYAARRPGGRLDRFLGAGTIAGVAVPEFVLAPWLVLVFAVGLGALPAVGWGGPQHLVLPVLTLAAYPGALAAQLVRAETAMVLTRPHVLVARAKGLGEHSVLWRHGARLATTSVTALAGLFVAGLLGGSVVVEVVFGIPGLGRLLHQAVPAQDLPVIQAGTLLVVTVAVVAGVLVEIVATLLDPVLRSAGDA
ncbi:Dipeptide transport system permease protein DppB [Pseudonocardia sp. Ae168_Ps1]|uniref:ABC transporter permease n=1 Tax=unclassified Pseudonocardia TaxID=2619320 RepID=UPI00094B4CE2|nr:MULTISPECIES: ABC transporter permease [unclassified Pseudonocardia]OLL74491.1 Dipeptide transport system permease protein DppB [Pseudonocardia sp. Ae150A_Ps1]OLL80471.1 Dipeptide transport system permease protein DppB [Pseudonocardia sp. Ae168_Ps1]OLL85402.1 Dipeptide transport system permease protein DppB [Pseudonocardia sp. Ae263_Ps1]OLL94571.1 Dipeptide transport system permease protein DppB [Pseudonocardia sp. Ae356_Ps1]